MDTLKLSKLDDNTPAWCGEKDCGWRGIMREIGTKKFISRTGEEDFEWELEPCCPKCGSTWVNWKAEEV